MRCTLLALASSIALMLTTSCSHKADSASAESVSMASTISEEAKPEVLGIKGEDIALRTGPGMKFKKLVNEKATQATGETEYCEVDYSVKVEALEKQGDWTKIRVVEPDWLKDTYIGWIPSKYIIHQAEKKPVAKLDPSEYKVLATRHNAAVENYHVLLRRKKYDKESVHEFIEGFRAEYCQAGCNVNVYDSEVIKPLIGVYPLKPKDYIKMADHFLSMSTFDSPELRDWYPYQDFQYKEYGGKNWKK